MILDRSTCNIRELIQPHKSAEGIDNHNAHTILLQQVAENPLFALIKDIAQFCQKTITWA